MPTVLPKGRIAATRINPKILLLYSLPKVGKTSSLAALDDCLILDLEGGADMYDAMRVPILSTKGIDGVIDAIMAEGKANGGKYPYKYIALDTLDKLEEYAELSATAKYKASKLGKTFVESYGPDASVLELPKGLGYYYLRNEVIRYVERLSLMAPYLILTSHVKDKNIEKGGIEVTKRDISLSGKLGEMMCARVDSIGYMYRDGAKLMVNFETYEGAVMGSRFPHLAGTKFEFDWDKIYLKEEIKKAA